MLWFGRESKLLGIWWSALFVPPLNPWLLRVATLLFALPGMAALLALARRLFGPQATVPTGLLLAMAPMHFFFERMALPDAQLVTPLALLLLALERTQARPQRGAARLAGAALAAVIMTKATALALLPPAAAGSRALAAQASLATNAGAHWPKSTGRRWRCGCPCWRCCACAISTFWARPGASVVLP